MTGSLPEKACRRRRIVVWMYERYRAGERLTDIADVCSGLRMVRLLVREDLDMLKSLGTLRAPSGLHVHDDYLLSDMAIADYERGLYNDEFSVTDNGLCIVMLQILRRARLAPEEGNEARGTFTVRGGPLRSLGVRYEEVFDYLDVLSDLGAVGLHRFINEVAAITLLPAGVRAAMSGSLDALQGNSREHNSGIQIGTVYGNVGAIGQAGRDLSQHVAMGGEDDELRRVLSDLTEAIRGLDRLVADKAVALAIAEQVKATVDAGRRDSDQVTSWWDYLGRFADSLAVAGAVGAPTTVRALYDHAAPLIAPYLLSAGG